MSRTDDVKEWRRKLHQLREIQAAELPKAARLAAEVTQRGEQIDALEAKIAAASTARKVPTCPVEAVAQ